MILLKADDFSRCDFTISKTLRVSLRIRQKVFQIDIGIEYATDKSKTSNTKNAKMTTIRKIQKIERRYRGSSLFKWLDFSFSCADIKVMFTNKKELSHLFQLGTLCAVCVYLIIVNYNDGHIFGFSFECLTIRKGNIVILYFNSALWHSNIRMYNICYRKL